MKKLRPTLAAASLALLGGLLVMPWEASAGTNRWTTEGPFGGVVLDLARDADDPDVLYAATEAAGVWKTVDGARSWFPVNSGLDRVERLTLEIEAHPTVSGTLYLATTGGLHRTTNGGEFWIEIGTSSIPFSGRLAVAPSNGETLYYGSRCDGLFKSLDGGLSWSDLELDVDGMYWDIVIDPNDPNTVYVNLGSDGLFKSTDGGQVWQRSDQGVTLGNLRYSGDVVIDPNDSDHLYWVHDFEVYRSRDGGALWSRVSPSDAKFESVAFDPRFPGRVYLGADLTDQLLWSDDGEQWFSAIVGRTHATVADFAFGPLGSDTVYLAERRGDGVYRNDGDGWKLAHQGMAASTIWDFAFDPNGPTTYAASFNGIHRRAAPGKPWELLPSSREEGHCCELVRLDPTQPGLVYAGSAVRGVLRSLDGGETWELANEGRESALATYDLALDPHRPSTLYLAAFDGVYRSDDRAQSWQRLDFGFPAGPVFHVLVDPVNPTTLYAATQQQLLKSLDRGATWALLEGAPVALYSDLALDPNEPETLYAVTANTLEISHDGGATWSRAAADGLPVTFYETVVVDPADSATLYVGTFEDLWRSKDGGSSFEPFEGGTGRDALVLAIAIDDGPVRTIYAGFDEGSAASLTRGCIDQDKVLCLDDQAGDKRFAVSIHYDTDLGGGFEGDAQATSLAPIGIADGGILSFFEPSNPEALVKLINGCGFNDHFWVFAAATTSVGFELTVEDTLARETLVYTNPDDNPAATITDTEAFATCAAGAQGPGDDAGASAEPHGDPGPRSVAANRRPIADPAKTSPAKTTDGEGCVADATTLCIDDEPGDRRFAVRLHFDSSLGGGQEGDAMATSLAPLGITDGGILSFFQVSLPEVLVKVIDGCGFNGAYWVFYAATTNLGFEMTVEDTLTSVVRTYDNPDAQPAATITDVKAFETCGS